MSNKLALHISVQSHVLFLSAIVMLFLTPVCHGQRSKRPPHSSQTRESKLTARQIADRLSNSLVVIRTLDVDGKLLGLGSGFFYGVPKRLFEKKTGDFVTDFEREFLGDDSPKPPLSSSVRSDLVVSNLHVFRRAWSATLKLVNSERTYRIKRIVVIDIKHDLCVFEVEGISAPPLMLADPEKTGAGDDVYVGSNPRGLENTISRGIISNVRSDEGLIQIDAAISAGSSGGPVVDTSGNVVGVAASSLSSGQNLNFAVAGSYLLKQRLNWNTSVSETGAFAISDAEAEGLLGRVRSVLEKVAEKEDLETDLYSIVPKLNTSYLYNEEGNHTQVTTFDSDGKFYSQFQTLYDKRGIRTHVKIIAQGYEPAERRYTDKENLDLKLSQRSYGITKESEYKAKSGKTVKETVTYDRNGNETERMRRASDGSYSRRVLEYDQRGRCTIERDYREGKLFSTTRYEYKVDAIGNWISKLAILDLGEGTPLIPNKLTLRDISYY
jgi:S1-C subfamily serine protease